MPPTPEEFRSTLSFLSSVRSALLLTHERPDGDAVGSVAGLAHLLRALGKPADSVEVLLYAPPPERFAHLLDGFPVVVHEPGTPMDTRPADSWILADTCSYQQVSPVADAIRARGGVDWVIDHHLTRDPMFRGSLIDTGASATGLLAAELFAAAGITPSPAAARAMYTAIATDTGWFRHSSADARTYRAAAALVEAGARPAESFEGLFQGDSPARTRLLGEALTTLELHEGGRVACISVTQEAVRRAGAGPQDSDGFTDEPAKIRGVNVVVVFSEIGDGRIRCNFRSKRDVDVNVLAARLGGGGHARAAGARIPGPLPEVKAAVLAAVGEMVRAAGGGAAVS
jgi:phosphoesterase RecJ-like protein